ncbi:MAG: arylsulfatase [Chthoniobacteraceae bacterium]
MKYTITLLTALLLAPLAASHAAETPPSANPNILVILADDLGYGDVQCYNPERGKIPTPNIDKLATQGMRFTDGHSSSGVCTPSRYTLLTGRYHWRTRLQQSILGGMSPPLIPPDRLTLAGLLKQHGYATGYIGKWHLGMDMPRPITNGIIKNSPTSNGFDYYFGISASLDMPPYAFIENDHFTEAPTAVKNFLILSYERKNPEVMSGARKFNREGPAAPGFESVQALPAFAAKSVEWIKSHKDKPFLLYLALNSPHTPLAPTKQWKSKSGLGDYGDFVMQTDAVVGEVMAALEETGATRNTMVILTSDNGPATYVGTSVSENPRDSQCGSIKELEAKGHFPAGPLRGYKGSVYEGGHRMPFIIRWPEVVKAGSVCGQLVHQADLMRTFADVVGTKLPDNAGQDSFSLLPLLQGEDKPIREQAICATGTPSLRQGPWKLILGGDAESKAKDRPPVQLYNLADDLSESKNLAAAMPEKVAEMKELLEKLITEGRSTSGAAQKNDVEVIRYPHADGPNKKKR